MLRITNNKFDRHLQLSHTVAESSFTDSNIRYFDNDGFELTGLEVAYYQEHGIDFVENGILNHKCDQRPWIVCEDANFIVDHSIILQKWEFTDSARYQITNHLSKYPQLVRFLSIAPKWGIDFALDYYDRDVSVEVIHIENDYRSFQQAVDAKAKFEEKVMHTDWTDFVKSILKQKDQWCNLTGFAQNDWKAVYWGLPKAEITQKAYV